MFPGNIEVIIAERRKDLLRQTERMRLVKILRHEQSHSQTARRTVTHWMGAQMVRWGLKLQGYNLTSAPPVAIASNLNTDH